MTAAASVVTISITAGALAAIVETLPDGREADRCPDSRGYLVTLPQVGYRLKARGPAFGPPFLFVATPLRFIN